MTRIPGYQRHLYPTNWNQISKRIKTKAAWRCEGCKARHRWLGIIIETHHIDSNPQNIEDDNLIALCERCHLKVRSMMPQPRSRSEVIERLKQLPNFKRLEF